MMRKIGLFLGVVLAFALAAQAQEGRAETAPAARAASRGGRHGKASLAPTVLHFDFSGKSGGTAVRDASGRGNDGTAVREWERVAGMGRGKSAARFTGDGNYVRVPRSESLEPDELTLAVWMRLGDIPGTTEPFSIAFKRNSAFHWNEDYSLECYPNRVVRITVGNPGARQIRVDSRKALAPGLWHHVAMVLRRGSVALYFDGEEVATGICPFPLDHNPQADLLIGARDHAAYPMDRFARCDFSDVRIWNKPLAPGQIRRLYRERAKIPGVARPEENKAPAAISAPVTVPPVVKSDPSGTVAHSPCSIPPPADNPRVFHPGQDWPPPADIPPGASLQRELQQLVLRGRRTHAATPEFLDALEAALARHPEGASCEPPPSDKLPFRPAFSGPSMPAGWSSVKPNEWRFGDGAAEQLRGAPNQRFLVTYDPGKTWTDYEFSFRIHSDAWFTPPARASAFVYFRYHGLDDSYCLTLEGAGELILFSLDKERAGEQRLMALVPCDPAVIRDGKPWTIRVQGDTIEVLHEGVRHLMATDSAHSSGTIGLEGVHIPMRFTEVSVEPIQPTRWRR